MRTASIFWIAIFITGMSLAQEPSVPTYKINPERSNVEIHVFRGGLFKALGHDHLIVAGGFSGIVRWDAGKANEFSVTLAFDSRSLAVLDPGASQKDRNTVQETMISPEVLDVTKFPRITFQSSRLDKIVQSGDVLEATLIGKLDLHGIEKAIIFPVRVLVKNNQLHATGSATVTQSDFDMVPVKAVGGTVRVKDQVKISFDILAEKLSSQ